MSDWKKQSIATLTQVSSQIKPRHCTNCTKGIVNGEILYLLKWRKNIFMSHHFPLFDGSRLNARRRTRSLKRHPLLVISRYYYAQKPRHTHTHTVCSYKIHGQKAACVFVRVFRLRRTENRNKIEKCEPLLVRGGGEKLVAAICWRNGDSGRRNSLAGGWNSLIGWRDKATSLELALGRPAK